MITLNGVEIKPTIFPDKTSQVWKLPEEMLDVKQKLIVWEFENEAEFMHLAQLVMLLKNSSCHVGFSRDIRLMMPYLPYGRQDKTISNSTTFSLKTFGRLLESLGLDHIETLDMHNPSASICCSIKNILPNLDYVLSDFRANLVCFPDKGASTRGYKINVPSFSLEKVRDPATGEIKSIKCELPLDLSGQRVLIVDDITDGGATFIKAAEYLYNLGADRVGLYTTHGIYSKGLTPLVNAKIYDIYNRKGKVDIK